MKLYLAVTLLPTIAGFGEMNPVYQDGSEDEVGATCYVSALADMEVPEMVTSRCCVGINDLIDKHEHGVANPNDGNLNADYCDYDGGNNPCAVNTIFAVNMAAVQGWIQDQEGTNSWIIDCEYLGWYPGPYMGGSDYGSHEFDDVCSEGHDGREGATSEARCTAMVGCMYDANSDHCFSATEGGVTTEAVGEGYD